MSEGKPISWRGYAVKDAHKPPFKFELIDFEPKKQSGYDVDISIEASGVCSSDTHTISGGWGPLSVKPLIPGHEGAGYVKAVGDKVQQFKVGDRVGVGAQVWSCGECEPCKDGNENYCVKMVDTYNADFPDGTGTAHGSYAASIRVPEHWVFKLPDNIPFEEAGPLQCAGITVFSPLKRNGCGPGKKVGIVGIGGLGHLAVQFAKALGAHVTAFTTSEDKLEDAKKMGADEAVKTDKEGKFAEERKGRYDLLLCTIDSADGVLIASYCSMLKVNKPFAIVGLPDESIDGWKPAALTANGAYIGVSHIGSPAESREMLEVASKHGVKPWLQKYPMKEAGKANEMVYENKVRYRGVLIRDI